MLEEEDRHPAEERVLHHAEEQQDANIHLEERDLSAVDQKILDVLAKVEAAANAACAEARDSECSAELK
jgi:hypothetical protein